MIDFAKSKAIKEKNGNVEFYVTSSDKLAFIQDKTVDLITIVLAIQNIEKLSANKENYGKATKWFFATYNCHIVGRKVANLKVQYIQGGVRMTLGENIKHYRKTKKLSQEKIKNLFLIIYS